MQKAVFVLLFAVVAASAYPNLPIINIPQIGNALTANLPAILSGQPAAKRFVEYLKGKVGDGVKIQFPDGALTLGSDALPSLVTCNLPVTKLLACHICNLDCVYIHNTYGGDCSIDSVDSSKGPVCNCQDQRNANGTLSTPVQTCGALFGPALDPAVDAALIDFLYARDTGALCTPLGNGTYTEAGCNSDCYSNHQYKSGTCRDDTTIPMTADQTTGSTTKPYCMCSYDEQPAQ